jgi:hypothetical protein
MLIVKYESGELIKNASWNTLPKGLIYSVRKYYKNKSILLSGYKEYNHLIEKVYGVLSGDFFIRNVYLMGKTETYSDVIKINHITDEIIHYKTEHNKEYDAILNEEGLYVGRPSAGWKEGKLLSPHYIIF